LQDSRWLASDAAACTLQRGDPGQAVELLERGRAVQWTQRLTMATDLDLVRAVAPEIAQRLEHARAVLDGPAPAEPANQANDARIRAAADWDHAVAELAELPETELAELFAPARPIIDQLQLDPLPGTVVIVNVSRFRCDAILLDAERIRTVELTQLDLSELGGNIFSYFKSLGVLSDPDSTDSARGSAEAALAGVLHWLWDAVASTVLANIEPGRRVWWCPTGPLTYLPLHAAGQVPDRTVSSYTPTIGALLRARTAPKTPSAGTLVLGVAVPAAPDVSPLPAATREVEALKSQLRTVATVIPLHGRDASRDRVRKALTEHTWAHLACHAEQDPANPSQASLVLADGRLSLAEISTQSGHHAEGAYLSACQTALGGVELSDEALHLAAALQYAGFRRVIGTLWPIGDATARPVARRIYSVLTVDGTFRPERSAYAVTEVTRWLRTSHSDAPSRWAPYVHIGP
jgi:CHAT domain